MPAGEDIFRYLKNYYNLTDAKLVINMSFGGAGRRPGLLLACSCA